MQRSPRPPQPRWRGQLLGHWQDCVYGWAEGPSSAGEVVVELIGDGMRLALATAGIELPAIAGLPPEAANAGFVALIGRDRLRHFGHITARVANTDAWLEGSVVPARLGAAPVAVFGAVESAGGLRLRGWAMPDGSGSPPTVWAFDDKGAPLAQVKANRLDPHPRAAGLEGVARSFDLVLPEHLADGQVHEVIVCTGDGGPLNGSPVRVCVPPFGFRQWLQSLPLSDGQRQALETLAADRERLAPQSLPFARYGSWRSAFGEPPGDVQASSERVLVAVIGDGPDLKPGALETTLQSLRSQRHAMWAAMVWADPRGTTNATLAGLAADPRIRAIPPGAWRATLRRALRRSDHVAFIRAGDTWSPRWLDASLRAMAESGAGVAYCDAEDDSGGSPWFKPDWCLDTFLALPLLDHGFLARVDVLPTPSAWADHPADWPWQVFEALVGQGRAPSRKVRHPPFVHVRHALHRCGDGRPASAPRLDTPGPAARRLAVPALVQRSTGATWHASTSTHPHRVTWPDPAEWPSVNLIVPTRDGGDRLKACIHSLQLTEYPDLHITVVDNQSVDEATLAFLAWASQDGVNVLRWDAPFNFAALNNDAVRASKARVVGLVNDDVRALDAQWLRHMVRHLCRSDVAAVGAKLLWPHGQVQHLGVVHGMHGHAGHAGTAWRAADPGYHHLNQHSRSVSAATAACLLIRRSDYLAVGGMDADAFPVNFNDVDLCLRLRAKGRTILCHEAVLEHAESSTRGHTEAPERLARLARESFHLRSRWMGVLLDDPFYNPQLNLDGQSHDGLAIPPRHLHIEP